MKSNELKTLIQEAFSTGVETPESARELVEPRTYATETIRGFLGRSWSDEVFTPEFICEHYWALDCFTPKAFAYYMPAFLLAALKDSEATGIAVDSVLSFLGLQHHELSRDELPEKHRSAFYQWHQARLDGLSVAQLVALLKFVEWLASERQSEFSATNLVTAKMGVREELERRQAVV